MIKTEFNGNFGLGEIKRIQLKNTGLNSFYEIRFVNDRRKLYVCKLHCFLTDDGKFVIYQKKHKIDYLDMIICLMVN